MAEDSGGWPSEWHWAINRVVGNWRKSRPKQLRDALPGEFSCTRLRLIRANACRETASEAGEVIDCAKWMPTLKNASVQLVRQDAPRKVSARTGAYVCDQCKHPRVTNSDLIERLGLTRGDEDFSERTWRRYINDAQPMPIAQLRGVVAHAFGQGWLDFWQCISIWQSINELQAVQSGLRAIFKRVTERKAFVEHGEFDASEEEMMEEFAKQLRLIDREATRSIDERLRREDLPPDVREILNEVLTEKLSAKRHGPKSISGL